MPPSKKAAELDKKLKELDKKHGKVDDLGDELRIISMEYSDIKSRIEATDVLIDHVIHQLDVERKMRRLNMMLALTILVLVAIIVITISLGF
jgi:hypothetical protein